MLLPIGSTAGRAACIAVAIAINVGLAQVIEGDIQYHTGSGGYAVSTSLLTPVVSAGSRDHYSTFSPSDGGKGLCVVTIHGYGKVTGDTDPASTSEGEVKLAVDGRTLWVVEYDDVDMPVFGSLKSEGQPSYEKSNVVIFVDPETMKPFRAQTLP